MRTVRKIQVGGTLIPSVSLYLNRSEDEQFVNAVLQNREWTNVHGCRTMGKSSLYAQHRRIFEDHGIKVIMVDLASSVGRGYETGFEWIRALGNAISTELGIDHQIFSDVLNDLPSNTKAGPALETLILKGLRKMVKEPVLLVLDEYDYIQRFDYCDELLFAFRHLQSLLASPNKLRDFLVCFVGWQPLSQLGKPGAANSSPIAVSIEMVDFSKNEETYKKMAEAFSEEECPNRSVFESVLKQSGGQPLTTMELLRKVKEKKCQNSAEVGIVAYEMVAKSGLGEDIQLFKGIERAFTAIGVGGYSALNTYQALLGGNTAEYFEPDAVLLLKHGLVRKNKNRLEPKGLLFRRRFDSVWANKMISQLSESSTQYRGKTTAKSKGRKICVINTGGTIGMVQRGEKVVPPRDTEEFRSYFSALDSIAETVDFINLFTPRDSINIFPSHWAKIARYIYLRQRQGDSFDGFVVAHGTDTMAFSASAVAFALGKNLSFPVVFTGSQTTVDVAHGDAHINLYRACEVAKLDIPEVVICFDKFVYRAVRAQKIDDRRFEGFASPTYPPLAEITGEINVRRELLRALPEKEEGIKLQATFKGPIMLIQQFPGLKPEPFEKQLEQNTGNLRFQGVILQTFGAGNVANKLPYSLMAFINKAYRKGIPVIITSQYPPDPGTHTMYTPAEAPLKAGAIHAGNMTLAAAVAKFQWVLAKVTRRANWGKMNPEQKKALVSKLMVEDSVVGEF
jgi:L-asparaginase